MPQIQHGGVRLQYDVAGAGELVLLLVHGWGSDSRTWASHIPMLARRYRVLTVDIRGHGRSSTPATGYDPFTIADDLVRLLDHLGIAAVVAVGHSWGGQIVTALAVEHPRRVAALVVLDPAYGAQDESALREQLGQWRSKESVAALLRFAEAAFSGDTQEDVRELVREGFRSTSPHVLAEAFSAMYLDENAFGLRGHTEEYLRRVTQPTLSLFSTEAAAGWARGLRAAPGSRVVVCDGAGHYLHQERPKELVALIEEWLPTARP
jgi:pimeloyl-ACP methyl ester carboxylesterase